MSLAQLLADLEAEDLRRHQVRDLLPGLAEDRQAESCTVARCRCGVLVAVDRAQTRVVCSWCGPRKVEEIRGRGAPWWMLGGRR